jgi:hypothetical protein
MFRNYFDRNHGPDTDAQTDQDKKQAELGIAPKIRLEVLCFFITRKGLNTYLEAQNNRGKNV